MFLVLKHFVGLSEQGTLRNSFLTIGTHRTCDVFRFVHSGCKGCDGEICMCEIYAGAFSHVDTSRIRAPTSPSWVCCHWNLRKCLSDVAKRSHRLTRSGRAVTFEYTHGVAMKHALCPPSARNDTSFFHRLTANSCCLLRVSLRSTSLGDDCQPFAREVRVLLLMRTIDHLANACR